MFRVYANLLQIPVLILDSARRPVAPIPPEKFRIQFDEETPIRPRQVRLEGEDPITLAVLVDTSQQNGLLPSLSKLISQMAPDRLTHADRIVIYGTDGCSLVRYGLLLPVQRALVEANLRTAAERPPFDFSTGPCPVRTPLWKSMALVASRLNGEPGRRILLAVTNGVDTAREFSSANAHEVAVSDGVAIFAIAEHGRIPPLSKEDSLSAMQLAVHGATELATVTELTGGIVLDTEPYRLKETLERFVSLVRGRYIVEFDRPTHMAGGRHILTVSCGQPRYFIRSAGTSLPTADPRLLDPSVQPGPASSRPPDPDHLVPGRIAGPGSPQS
jgi:hypothetical protein